MDELEYEILDALYFVEPFETLLNEVKEKRVAVIKDCLRQLIIKQWVNVMSWDENKKEFVSTPFFDFDNMESMHFFISKQGLIAHNSKGR
jgi:hypothetical protein